MPVMRGLFLLLLAACSCAAIAEPSVSDILASVRRYVSSAEVAPHNDDAMQAFSGEYNTSRPALSGDDLYLFPDSTYIYTKWADILLPTIYDKGTWRFDGQFVRLMTDNSIPQEYSRHDRLLIPLMVETSGTKHLFLLGITRDYRYLLENAKDGDELMFLIRSRTRVAPISDTIATKSRLMQEAWKPKFFQE